MSGSSFDGSEAHDHGSMQVPGPNVQVGGSSGSADLAPCGAGVFPQGDEVPGVAISWMAW